MSNVYIQEPPTNGKVLLHTTVGDIDIELWSKETPKACRNFIQLCLEGYYDETVFHRVVKGFIVQGGDPLGDGTGGESVYGAPFKDEFHSRLRFVRRGLVAMANSGKDDNGSQFFFTLGATPELQNKNTLFGKVTGNTLYNMLKLEEGLVDQDDRPLYPHKIISCKVLSNPFPDIIPRLKIEMAIVAPEKPKEKTKKNFKLLSFGEEAEEDEAEMEIVNQLYKSQSKSSHDLTNDPNLSSIPAVSLEDNAYDKVLNPTAVDSIRKKFEKANEDKLNAPKPSEEIDVDRDKLEESEKDDHRKRQSRKEIQNKIRELKRELRNRRTKESEIQEKETEGIFRKDPLPEGNNVLSDYHKEFEKYDNKRKSHPRKGTAEREQQTLQILEKFRNTLSSVKRSHSETDEDHLTISDHDNETWLVHQLRTEESQVVLAKDANLTCAERYDLSDPRHPIAERRRKKERKQTKR